ncbi:MAG: DUF2278 family protein [Bacteroidetes bacterium]|nr:DUF2278 family protein [Bacteroidota bacterium]
MSRHHNKPLRPGHGPTHGLPHNIYGVLTGTIDGPLSDADDNHVFISVRVAAGKFAGRYKLAFNTESQQGHAPVQYCIHDEPIEMADVPAEGFDSDASLSYSPLGLKQADFRTVQNGRLRTIVHDSALDADLTEALGFTFSDGTGIHDLHYNNGEKPGSSFPNHPDKDGALVFYYLNRFGETRRRWIFIKFDTQTL